MTVFGICEETKMKQSDVDIGISANPQAGKSSFYMFSFLECCLVGLKS